MRNRGTSKALCLVVPVFFKFLVAKPLSGNDLYEHWDPETNRGWYCREVLVKRGFEGVPCVEPETEDSIRKCQTHHYQPDETFSSNMPQCMAELTCTDEGIRKDSKCIDGYCWTICVCNLEVGKCGLNPSVCIDAKEINCVGKVLQDCSCAQPNITSTLPTSPPTANNISTILKPLTAKSSLPASTEKPWTDTTKTNKIDATKDGSDIGAKGNELGTFLPIIIIGAMLVLLASYVIYVQFHKQCHNRLTGDLKGCCKILGSKQTDPDENNGLHTEQGSETDDSGASGLSQGSNENFESGELNPNSNNLSNGLDPESGSEPDDPDVTHPKSASMSCSGTKLDDTGGNDSDHGTDPNPNPSSCHVEMKKDSKHREEPILIEEKEDGCQESDPLLSTNYPGMSDLSQRSDENCESGEANPDRNNLSNGVDPECRSQPDDPAVTHPKSASGTKLDHTGGNESDHGIDPDPSPSLCQLELQKDSKQREKPKLMEKKEDGYLESDPLLGPETSLQVKKVAVINPFRKEVQTFPVQDSPPAQNAETEPLRGEGHLSDSGFSFGGAAANLSMDWSSFGSSVYYESRNQ